VPSPSQGLAWARLQRYRVPLVGNMSHFAFFPTPAPWCGCARRHAKMASETGGDGFEGCQTPIGFQPEV